jgi:hypothetical protein
VRHAGVNTLLAAITGRTTEGHPSTISEYNRIPLIRGSCLSTVPAYRERGRGGGTVAEGGGAIFDDVNSVVTQPAESGSSIS